MEEWIAKIQCLTETVGEYWKWLTGTGLAGLGAAGLVWLRKTMVKRTARKIYAHMTAENAARRARLGPGQQIIEDAMGFTTRHQDPHYCGVACLKKTRVLGDIACRWLAEAAFKRLRDEGLVVISGDVHYVTGTEPRKL